MRVSIAPLGDYTIRLSTRLHVGAVARVEGPFGHFCKVRGPQTWIAAGIGITPFAAMAGTLDPRDGPVTLIYSVRSCAKAAHLDELQQIASANPNFTLILRETAMEGRLDADIVAAMIGDATTQTVLFCGPAGLRDGLRQGLGRHGFSARRFRYEMFELRTGVGLKALSLFLAERAVPAVQAARARRSASR